LCFVFCFVGFLKDSVRVFAGALVAEEEFDLDGVCCGSALDVSSNVLRRRLRALKGKSWTVKRDKSFDLMKLGILSLQSLMS
jgi:hypothetical protein